MYYEELFVSMTSTWWYRTTPRGDWTQMPAEYVARKAYELAQKVASAP